MLFYRQDILNLYLSRFDHYTLLKESYPSHKEYSGKST